MGSSAGNFNLDGHSVFVYGSLLADDVVRVLLNRIPQSSSAALPGYHRFSIKGRVYPAILPVENKRVTGKVLFGITDPELNILDEFEDFEYQRTTVDVSLMDTAEKLQVQAYVWSNQNDPDLYGEWDFEVLLCELLMSASILKPGPSPLDVAALENTRKMRFPFSCLKEWRQLHMKDFVKMTTGFVEELDLPEAKPRVATYESFYQQNADNSYMS